MQQSAVWTFTFQLKAKRSECNSKATHARNDYLLTLAAANAHQQRYYDTDLTDCIKVRKWALNGRVGGGRYTCTVNLYYLSVSAGLRWQNLWAGKRLPGLAVSDWAGNLPGCPQHLQPALEQLKWGKTSNLCVIELNSSRNKCLWVYIVKINIYIAVYGLQCWLNMYLAY